MGKTSAELLSTPVQFLKGVGPARAEAMARLNLHTTRDLLFYFPRDYHDLSDLTSLDELTTEQTIRVRGTVSEIDQRTSASSGSVILGVLFCCPGGFVRGVWFNQPFMRQRFEIGQDVLLTGKAKFRGMTWEISHPLVQWLDTDDETPQARLLPIYPLTEGLNQAAMRRAVAAALEGGLNVLEETFTEAFRQARDLCSIHEAIAQIHFPADRAELDRARHRLVYQELLVLQLALAVRRKRLNETQSPVLAADARIDARIRRLFPFELTAGQQQAIAEVRADLARNVPMNRLLQGDVGSGKTVVAVYAMLTAVAHGQQAALMAPTEVLARQHAQTLESLLTASRVRWCLLTGSLTASQRSEAHRRIAAAEYDVVIGTQAIVSEAVEFARLALVVIDEQHKFGVRQRARLRQSAMAPHYLVMTATPIPRTVAMTEFGDLDVSTITDMPPGRVPIHTYLPGEAQRDKWWDFVGRKLREGRQAFVVAPQIAGDEDDAASVSALYESLANGPLEAFRLGLLHGRLTPAEKDAAMQAFRDGRTQVLVCTTVVEVGIDVPNATLLTIEGGERFGLSQLHQLRGRVGRGSHPGYCCVFADTTTDDARRRLQSFVETTDGFRLAEIDFQLRGPGDLLGTRQHGLPPLRIADLSRDAAVLETARHDARELVASDPELGLPQHHRLRQQVFNRYGQVLELGDVG